MLTKIKLKIDPTPNQSFIVKHFSVFLKHFFSSQLTIVFHVQENFYIIRDHNAAISVFLLQKNFDTFLKHFFLCNLSLFLLIIFSWWIVHHFILKKSQTIISTFKDNWFFIRRPENITRLFLWLVSFIQQEFLNSSYYY